MKKLLFCLVFLSCASPEQSHPQSTEDDQVWNQELRVLQAETPRDLSLPWIFQEFGYTSFPTQIVALKGKGDTPAHKFLMRLGQQIFQQALLADKTQDETYADNARLLLLNLVDSNLGFANDPQNPTEVNDNRYLELGWFLSLVSRGARILDLQMTPEWKKEHDWDGLKAALNSWIGERVDQNWPMTEALQKKPLDLVLQNSSMNWVGTIDTRNGATNRTFTMLEAAMHIAELRGGALGPVKLATGAVHNGSIGSFFTQFRHYLKYYFSVPVSRDPTEFVLRYAPTRSGLNDDPEKLNVEPCLDPLQLGIEGDCLLNKDAYRNDTFHAQMGLAAVLHIIDLGKRWGYELSSEEKNKVAMGLRWAAFNNVAGVTADQPAYGIAVWELAFQHFPPVSLGPYCARERDSNRLEDGRKKASLAWGYSRLARGF